MIPYIPLIKAEVHILFAAFFRFYIIAGCDNGVDKLQKIEGLPVNKSALKSYTDTNTELQIIDSYTDNMKIKQQ